MSKIPKVLQYVSNKFPYGQFKFIVRDKYDVKMFQDMFRAIEKENAWNDLRLIKLEQSKSKRFDLESKFDEKITKHIKINHSGSSYSWTMFDMNYIAHHGWRKYVLKRIHDTIPVDVKK